MAGENFTAGESFRKGENFTEGENFLTEPAGMKTRWAAQPVYGRKEGPTQQKGLNGGNRNQWIEKTI